MILIDADDLKRKVYKSIDVDVISKTYFYGMIKNAPIIEAEPIRHGHWVEQEPGDWRYSKEYRCSECGKYRLVTNPAGWEWHYCPHCGARMDGVKE